MANENKKKEKESFISKKNESKVQKAERTRKTIYGAFIGVIVLILIFVGLGVGSWFKNEYKPSKTTVISVYDRNISARDFADALAYVSAQYPQYASLFTSTAAQNLELAEVVYRKATELGYSVEDKTVQDFISYYKLANNQAVRDIIRAGFLQNTVRDEYFAPKIEKNVEHRKFDGMFIAAKSDAEYAVEQLKNGANFDQLVLDLLAESTSTTLHPNGIFDYIFNSEVMDDAVFSAEKNVPTMFEDPNKAHSGGYWFVRVDEYDEARSVATVSVIAAADKDSAADIEKEFADGEDFDTIAANYSINYSDQTGVSQVKVASDSTLGYASFVFDSERKVGDISGAIYDGSTTINGGYWVIVVDDIRTKDMTDDDLNTLASIKLSDWSTEILDAAKDDIKEDLNDEIIAWAVKRVTAK